MVFLIRMIYLRTELCIYFSSLQSNGASGSLNNASIHIDSTTQEFLSSL